MDKTYKSVATNRIPRPRSKRLRELGGTAASASSTVVNVSGSEAGVGSAHTHINKAVLDKISTDAELYLYLDKLVENEEGTEAQIVATKAKAGHADEATHAVAADEATHAAKAHDVDEDSPVYDKFLRKDVADEAAKMITFLEGLFVGRKGHGISVDAAGAVTAIFDELKNIFSLASPAFVSGDLGSGFTLSQDPQTGESYLEVDRMLVRKLAYFVELVIKRLSYVGAEIILTPASMKCTKVEELPTCYRCYFEQDDGQKSIKQEFRAGDQARAQTFNIKEGTSHHASNKYYWRLVEAVGINYIDLSKTDCDAGSGLPEAGDEIVQLGNRTDATRQNAIILSTVGDDAPSIKQYKGINAYALAGKEVTILSPTLNKIIGQFISEATGKSFDEIIQAVQVDLGLIKEQTDKEYTIWFFEYIPTLTNIPASNWTTNELKTLHEQDMFYNRDSGLAYRFVKSGSTWEWAEITDQQTLKALENAAKAQDTADGKRRVFVARPTKEDAYDVGDMWVNATYGELYDNDSLVCRTAKAAGEDFSIEHWKSASNATTAYIKNLGDSILFVVEENKEEANKLLEETIGIVDTIREDVNKTNEELGSYATVIEQTKESITLVAGHFNDDGSLKNCAGLVTTADANTLYAFDADGNIVSFINQTPTGIKISAKHINLTGAVTFSSFSNDLQTTINGKAEANSLGDLAKLDAIEKANLGITLVAGGYLKTELIDVENLYVKHIKGGTGDFSGTVKAQDGTIGGLKISGNSLTNEGFDNDATIILRNDYYGIFSAIGTNTLPAMTGLRAVARFENKNTREGTLWGSTNYAVIINAANAANNYALLLENGYVGGFRIKTLNVASSTTYDKVSNAILLSGTGTVVLTLPTLTQSENGQFLMVKNVDGGVKRVKPSAGQPLLLDQQTWVTSDSHEQLATAGDAMTFVFFWGVGRENKGDTGTWVQWKNPQNW